MLDYCTVLLPAENTYQGPLHGTIQTEQSRGNGAGTRTGKQLPCSQYFQRVGPLARLAFGSIVAMAWMGLMGCGLVTLLYGSLDDRPAFGPKAVSQRLIPVTTSVSSIAVFRPPSKDF